MLIRIFSGAENMASYTSNLTTGRLTNLIAFLESRRTRIPAPGTTVPPGQVPKTSLKYENHPL